jgi:3-carboxy-cis,cis-muconate cycloisomerase
VLTAGALRWTAETVEGLEVDPARMRANLDVTRGLIMAEAVQMALGAKIGRQAAHKLLERASKRALAEGRHLKEALAAEPEVTAQLTPADLDRLLDPLHYTGVANQLIDRALAARAAT